MGPLEGDEGLEGLPGGGSGSGAEGACLRVKGKALPQCEPVRVCPMCSSA